MYGVAETCDRGDAPGSQAALHADLHAALDAVLERHTTPERCAEHGPSDAVEMLDSVEDLHHRLRQLVPDSYRTRAILPPRRPVAELTASSGGSEPAARRDDATVWILSGVGAAVNRCAMQFIEEAAAPGVEMRALPGLPTWLIVIGRAGVVLPRDPDDARLGAVLLRAPGAVAVATWAFQQAWQAATPAPARVRLSARDAKILGYLSGGFKDEHAARQLRVSVRTYRRHVTSLCERLGASSRFEAGVRAAEWGLICEPPRD